MDDFMLRAMLAGVGVALAAGPLGSFVVWKRMAFFGDALAHSALLGIALAFALHIPHVVGIVVLAAVFSFVIVAMNRQRSYSTDTVLGIVAHSALALGVVVASFIDKVRVDMMSFLFGDILGASMQDIALIYAGAVASCLVLVRVWRPLLLCTLSEDLAKVEGVDVDRARLIFMLLISFLVALSIKVVGILLVTSLLIIPAATARRFSHTPERMAILSSVIGALAVVIGLQASLRWDTPSGPSIVVAALLLFLSATASGRK